MFCNNLDVLSVCRMTARSRRCGRQSFGLLKYYYNVTSGRCEEFSQFNCGTNANSFHSLEECQKTCYYAPCKLLFITYMKKKCPGKLKMFAK